MKPADLANLAPFVRIGLYVLAGYFYASDPTDPIAVMLRTDPALLAAVTAAVAGGWYALAKWGGWRT